MLRCAADLSGHHVPMFAVADGPPGVAAAHLSSQEKGSEGVHTVSPERSAIIDKLQVCLAACASAVIDDLVGRR